MIGRLGISLAAWAFSLAGCSIAPSDLELKAAPAIRNYPENYQEIYRRVSTALKRCGTTSLNAYASMAADSELYPDLGYGEVSYSLINWGVRNYYMTAKIEKLPTGSKITVYAGNSIASDQAARTVLRWASGDQGC